MNTIELSTLQKTGVIVVHMEIGGLSDEEAEKWSNTFIKTIKEEFPDQQVIVSPTRCGIKQFCFSSFDPSTGMCVLSVPTDKTNPEEIDKEMRLVRESHWFKTAKDQLNKANVDVILLPKPNKVTSGIQVLIE